MPTYEFTCPQGHDFEKFFRSMASAPTVVPCPVCGEPADRQVSAGAGLVFHGSGFYITDYGKDGKKDQKPAHRKTSESTKDSGGESKSAQASSTESKSSEQPKPDSGSASSGAGDSKPATPAADSGSTAKPSPAPKVGE